MKPLLEQRSISAFAKYHATSTDIKEKMLQDSLTIKTQLNKYKDELLLQKKLNEELAKENRNLNAIVDKLLSDSNIAINQEELHRKINESFLAIELKKDIKALIQEIKSKQETIDEYKKHIKLTQKHEFSIENEIIMKEMAKIKILYLESKKELDYYKRKSYEVMQLKNEFVKQNYIILSLNEKNNLYLKEIKSKNKDIEQINKKFNNKEVWYKNARLKLKYQEKLNDELIKNNSSFSQCIKGDSNRKYKIVNANILNRNKSFLLIKRKCKNNRNINMIRNSNSNSHHNTHYSKMNIRTESNLLNEKIFSRNSNNNDKMRINKSFHGQRRQNPQAIKELALLDSDYKEISYILMKTIEGKDLSTNQLEQLFATDEIQEAIAKSNIIDLSSLFGKKLCSSFSM